MKYYRVTGERGHCGTKKSCELTFYIKAENLIEAMDKAKEMPAIKHSRMPLNVVEISKEDYWAHAKRNAYHPCD